MEEVSKEIFDWKASPREDIFSFMLCEKNDNEIKELYELTDIIDCECEWNDNTSLKMNSKISHIDSWDQYENKLIRIYQVSKNRNQRTKFAWGTFRIYSTEQKYDDVIQSSSTELKSVISYLDDTKLLNTISYQKGENIAEIINEMCDKLKMPYNEINDTIQLSKNITYQIGQSYLSVINDLLNIANYSSTYADEYGTLIFEKYVAPQNRNISWVYDLSDEGLLFTEQEKEYNTADIPNVVIRIYESESLTLVGIAKNKNVASPYSIQIRGYEKTDSNTVSDIGTSNDINTVNGMLELQEKLDALAKKDLDSATDTNLKWKVSSPYTPIDIRNVIQVYTLDDTKFKYSVKSITRKAVPGVEQSLDISKFTQ